ncbi:MAG: aminopeptidase family protein P, partial [Boseongicola sp.]|nr:aminopeptidase family protein P [Boseongicola sp.]
VDWPATKLGPWLNEHSPEKAKIGFDPWLHTADEIKQVTKSLSDGRTMVATENLIDAIWDDRPPRPAEPVLSLDLELAGESSNDKRERIAEKIKSAGQSAAVITLPDSICWLLNIRGSDIPRNPIVHAFAILFDTGRVSLFSDIEKFAHLGPDPNIDQFQWDAFEGELAKLEGVVRVDPKSAPVAVSDILKSNGIDIAFDEDPCILPKARKNATEIASTRKAHMRDAAAMVEFLTWFDRQAAKGGETEISAAKALEGYRRATNALMDIAFDTISGSGPNGAIVHYRVTEGTNRAIKPGELYLVDSGGQYVDGTTDITRTIAVGEPGAQQKQDFTRVLQGMIAISRVRFPRGLAGRDLDALARAPLWTAGQDYDHGTGHGVGVFLCVHEGPQRLSRISEVPLEPGMILSNEPGYYREGEYGIRIENLIVVQEAPKAGDNRDQLNFETLTWVPIDRRLVDVDLLSSGEREWLNSYHAEVYARLNNAVSDDAKDWLKAATSPI